MLEFRLGASVARLRLAPDATVLAVGDHDVSSWDLGGRPYVLVRAGVTYRRGLDGGMLAKGRVWHGDLATPFRRRLDEPAALAVAEAARSETLAARAALPADAPAAARERLDAVVAMDAEALARDASRFRAIYSPVGILPPDQYLAIVVQATDGCSWNQCRFCSLYAGVAFRVRTEPEFRDHLCAVHDYLGPALPLRRSVFVGAANALCVARSRLEPLLRAVADVFPLVDPGLPAAERRAALDATPGAVTGLHAFLDAWTGERKPVDEWRAYAALGLRRVYVGLETGDPALLDFLGKPGDPEQAVALVRGLREAGIAAGVIVLAGAGGGRFAAAHAERTADVLSRMELRAGDLVYVSDLLPDANTAYAALAREAGALALTPEELAQQRAALTATLPRGAAGPKVARYDLDEFVY